MCPCMSINKMNEIHRDFLVTYDPGYFEEHSESSEFEESTPSITSKDSNQFLLTKENKKVTKKHKDNLNRKIYTNHESLKKHKYNNLRNLEEKIVQTTTLNTRNMNGKVAESGDKEADNQCYQNYKQKKSLIRHKVIPCLSSMFGRSVSKLSPKENQNKNVCKENSIKVECSNEQRRRKKTNRQQDYTVQPVYEIKGIMHGKPYCNQNTPTVVHDTNKSLKRVYSNIICNVTLSDDEAEKLEKLKKRKYKKRLQSELKEANLKLKYNKNRKHHCQQFPSKQSLYHVYTTSNQGQYKVAKAPPQNINSLSSELSLTSSGFWDYLIEKFNKKGTIRNKDAFRKRQRKDFAIQCCPVNFDTSTYGPYTEARHVRKNYTFPDEDCPCSETNISYPRNPCRDFANNFDADKRKNTESKNTQCECYPPRRPKPMVPKQCIPMPVQPQENICGCQQPHDDMVEAVCNKYNGEILCIHNPPCILINGCLNLTQPQEASPVNAWPVVETKKDSLFRGYKKGKSKQKQEQYSQYHAQCVEVRQCQPPEKKTEKIIQSICNHNPPCEVVRCCYKPKYDPKLQNSCVHVPMCPKVRECLLQKGRDNKTMGTCEHKPKCPEVPLCTRKYVELTPRVSIGTQVKPQMKMFCRHEPPCILIPKCLGGNVQETYISYEAIPNCVHQPLCDLIPACCRKSTKGMVSTCCQYPNGCRVV